MKYIVYITTHRMPNSTGTPAPMAPTQTPRPCRVGPSTPGPRSKTPTKPTTVLDTARGICILSKLTARRMANRVTLEILRKFKEHNLGTAGVMEFEENMKSNMKNPTDPGDHDVLEIVMRKKTVDARKSLKNSKRKEIKEIRRIEEEYGRR